MDNLNIIIKDCAEGDRKQQKILYEAYYGYGLSVALRYISQCDDARLVVNDAIVKFFRTISRFVSLNSDETEPQLMAWIKKIVLNTAIDQLRSMSKWSPIIQQNRDERCDTDNSILYKDLIRQVKIIPPSYSTVFDLHVIQGFKHLEIARHLGISVGTSKSNLSKAKNHLRKVIRLQAQASSS
jgi:RNA polymerase sigma factor (sigma-70 family)